VYSVPYYSHHKRLSRDGRPKDSSCRGLNAGPLR